MEKLEVTLGSLKDKAKEGVATLSIVIDGAEIGDTDDNIGIVTPERRKVRADLFRRDYFDGITVRPDVYRYLHFFYLEEDIEPLYQDAQIVYTLLQSGLIVDSTIPEYVKYSVTNEETAQLLGFILIFTEMLEYAREKRVTIKLVFEEPFAHIVHTSRLLDLIGLMIRDEKAFVKQIKI